MAESSYSIRLAAVNDFSAAFRDYEAEAAALGDTIRDQQSDLRRLNDTMSRVDGMQRMQRELAATANKLDEARVSQVALEREQRAAGERVEMLGQQYAAASAKLKAYEASTEASAGEVRSARAEQNRLERELGQASRAQDRAAAAVDKGVASVRTLEAAQRAQRNELGRSEEALRQAGVDTGRLADEQRRLEQATERANTALNAQRGSMERLGAAQGRVEANRAARADLHGRMFETAAIAYVASRPMAAGMDFERSMAGIEKLVNFDSEDDRNAMASQILKLSTDREIAGGGLDAAGIASIVEAGAQSNLARDELIPYARDAARMATAFDIDAQTAGQTMMQWRASMNLDQAQAVGLADTVNYVSDRSKNVTPAAVSEVLRRQGSVAMTAGFTPQQAAGLSAALLSSGAGEEISATALKNTTGALTKGSAATKSQREAMEQLGFDPRQLARDMQVNAPAATVKVFEALAKQPPEETSALISQLFGEESKGAITPLLTNLDNLRRSFALAGDTAKQTGSMQAEASRVADLDATSWDTFTAKIARTTTLIGTAMLPVMSTVLEPLGAAVDLVGDAAEAYPAIAAAIGTAAGALVALKVGALGIKFAGLLVGQAFNKAGLARAKVDARIAQTATAADGALGRLNRRLATLGAGGAGAGRGGRAAGAGAAAGATAGGAAAASRGGWWSRLSGSTKAAGAVAVPLMLTTGALQAADGVASGDSQEVGAALGSTGGGLAGAWAGGAAGAAVGSVVPVIGTAIGAAVGSIVGGMGGGLAGDWVGRKAGQAWDWAFDEDEAEAPDDAIAGGAGRRQRRRARASVPEAPATLSTEALEAAFALTSRLGAVGNRLASPEDAAKNVVTATDNRSVTVQAGAIQVQASGNRETDEALVQSILAQLEQRLRNGMGWDEAGLDVRIGAALTDGGGG
ncbi:MAG: phage tail tape measure protein [Pseudomonadota bacterium]|nr:phage tail tape measure protein [Pseudomonadota bacterium]